MGPLFVVCLLLAAAAAMWFGARRRAQRRHARQRLRSAQLAAVPATAPSLEGIPDGRLGRWLFLAGDRRPDAVARFRARTIAGAVLGAALGAALYLSHALDPVLRELTAIPGRVGLLFAPILLALPVLLPLMGAALPTLRVRRARRRRVRDLLADLQPALELFASLAQAGLAFDAALARVLDTLGTERPLGRELATFRTELLGGADRSRCFRRFARRIELPQTGSFTAAMIRAHEVGIGLAATLRRQALDLRVERRERALARAQSLPARLVVPLVLCFLPGIFVMSLGPAFYGFLIDTAGFAISR